MVGGGVTATRISLFSDGACANRSRNPLSTGVGSASDHNLRDDPRFADLVAESAKPID